MPQHDRGEMACLVMWGFVLGSLTIAGVIPWSRIFTPILAWFQ